jgi:hypothetical protein
MQFFCLHCGGTQAQVIYIVPNSFELEINEQGTVSELNKEELEADRDTSSYICSSCQKSINGCHDHKQFVQYVKLVNQFNEEIIAFLNGDNDKLPPEVAKKIFETFNQWKYSKELSRLSELNV